MPTKKKKPTLKSSSFNRGFATTSVPKKAEETLPDETGETQEKTPSNPVHSGAKYNGSSTPGAGGPAAASAAKGRYGFDEEDADQQDLQNLVEKHMDKIEKDVSRYWKIIEFDRRVASTLPTFELDKSIKDEILELASHYTRVKLSGNYRKEQKPNGLIIEDEPDELFPSLNPQAASFTPKTPAKLSASAAEFKPTHADPPLLPDWEDLPAPPLREAHEPFDKVLPRAMVTRALLIKLGFSPEQAIMAIAKSPSLELEECITYLVLRLGENEVEKAWGRTLEGAKKHTSRNPSANAIGINTPKREEMGNGVNADSDGTDDTIEETDVHDESRPPKHESYTFERRTEMLSSASNKVVVAATAAVDGPSLSSNKTASDTNGKGNGKHVEGGADASPMGKQRIIKPPPDDTIILPLYKVRELLKHAEKISSDINQRLADVEDDLDIYHAGPIAAWVSTRVALIHVEKMYGWMKRALGQAHLMSPLGQGYGAANALRDTQSKLFQRLAEAEKVPRWRKDTAESVLRETLRKEAELEKMRKDGPDVWVDILGDVEEQARAKEVIEKEEERRRGGEGYVVTGHNKALMDARDLIQGHAIEDEPEKDGEAAGGNENSLKKAKKDSKKARSASKPDDNLQGPSGDAQAGNAVPKEETAEEEGGMFGQLLEERTQETRDAKTNAIVRLRTLPPQAKSGGGGKSPQGVLLETLRRLDLNASVKYAAVGGGGWLCRSQLTMRWCGPDTLSMLQTVPAAQRKFMSLSDTKICVDTFALTGEGCETQQQAHDLIATVALNCIERDRPVQRLLSTGYRDWWDELENARGRGKDSSSRDMIGKVRDAILPRLANSPASKESNVVALDTENKQRDFRDLANSGLRHLDVKGAQRLQESFEKRVASPSYQTMLVGRKQLPIYSFRDHILEVLENSQVFVLSGETGCGKSTQVPAYILEHCLGRGLPCKVYCTEPRRISAISLAERVSAEFGEAKNAVGSDDSLVGYSIRLESNVGRNAKLIYATTGIVLRMLEGEAFNEITHIIIDEVHERSIESDFLLIILKTLMQYRRDLKIILMSATVDAERISAYFDGCPTVSVPGRTFPVNVRYLEDAVEMCKYILEDGSPYQRRQKRRWGQTEVRDNVAKLRSNVEVDDLDGSDEDNGPSATNLSKSDKVYSPRTIETIDRMDENTVNQELILSLLEQLCFNKQELLPYSAAVLIFMPGLAEIRTCFDLLSAHHLFGNEAFRIYPLHSTISSENQSAVFEVPPEGVRKIVIATNIAETGITIPDITCVIDTGRQREMRYDEKRQISRLVDCFVAKSNAKQRRGRAGRVREGLCFHLFTKLRHDEYLDEHPLPEMLRLSLQDLALKLKVMKVKIGTSIENALSQALDPPSPTNVQRAVASLVEVKALTTLEGITPLGRHLSRLPLDVHMAKFLLIAATFKCLDPALTIAAALNSKSPFVSPFGKEAQADAAKAGFKIADSDFMTIANAFNSWRRAVSNNFGRQFCQKNYLSQQNLQQIEELRQQYLAYLIDAGFLQIDAEMRRDIARARYRSWGRPRFAMTPPEYDIYSSRVSIVNAVAAAGLYPKLISIDPSNYSLRTLINNQPVSIHPSSVNFKSKLSELPKSVHHLLYFTIMQSKKLYAWDTAALDDRAILLLCGEADAKLSANSLYIDRRVRVCISDLRTNVALLLLREQMTKLINSSFRNPGKQWSDERSVYFDTATRMLGVSTLSDAILQQ
ncbi:P-loop containing nucleoside triphosphate hydrolase protein [Tilletiaria anomala UBC 951]|uniref:RNA helicase n=1 Tax=Tilletiaria anomala (strain ATCC 24038 / CBS 436.72 / UBC 951) TaxID=1037660 RepID=A0A066W020_TILAU|nr:P-loop containing nucleoside triphosphate hydrolase protein [Tilletiaria anomala UBC 951]KDN44394.1 P-loop containing nucleoside triphosphate hydrolase protein [Tilletiaria anomala UBC 951]